MVTALSLFRSPCGSTGRKRARPYRAAAAARPRRRGDRMTNALRCQQHLAADGGQVGHSQWRLLLRLRRRLWMQDRIAEPVIEVPAAAAIVSYKRRVRRTARTIRWAENPHMKVIIVSVPHPHFSQPRAIAAGASA